MKMMKIKKDRNSLVKISAILLISVISLILFRDILVFGIFLILSAFWNYYQSRLELEFDLSPALVLMIIFSMKLGFGYGMFFLLVGGLLPSAFSGGFTQMTIFFLGIAVLIGYLASLGITGNIMIYGIGLLFFQSVLGLGVSMLMGDSIATFSVFVGLGLNVVYFIVLNNIISLLI